MWAIGVGGRSHTHAGHSRTHGRSNLHNLRNGPQVRHQLQRTACHGRPRVWRRNREHGLRAIGVDGHSNRRRGGQQQHGQQQLGQLLLRQTSWPCWGIPRWLVQQSCCVRFRKLGQQHLQQGQLLHQRIFCQDLGGFCEKKKWRHRDGHQHQYPQGRQWQLHDVHRHKGGAGHRHKDGNRRIRIHGVQQKAQQTACHGRPRQWM